MLVNRLQTDQEIQEPQLIADVSLAGFARGCGENLEARLTRGRQKMNMPRPQGRLVEEDELEPLSNGHAMTEMCAGGSR